MTDLDAANRALILIGVPTIGSLEDQSQAARVMKGLLPMTKRTVLNEYPWSFVLRIEDLEPTDSGSVSGYPHAFKKPDDALSIKRVYSNDAFRGIADYRVVGNFIGANIEEGKLEYVAYVDDLNSWPQDIIECLVTRLASDASIALGGGGDLMTVLLRKYMTLASHAAEGSVVEENVPDMRASDYGYAAVRMGQTQRQ